MVLISIFIAFVLYHPGYPSLFQGKHLRGLVCITIELLRLGQVPSTEGKRDNHTEKSFYFCDMKTEIQDGQIALTPYKRIQFYIQLFSLLFSLRRQETQIAYARKRHSSINKFHTF